ncbi:hypothetical protein [Rothia terrae]|uniref:Uncharacterized protein n=1 Tax=Rothia terrae TaxID=396015 RepID=A0A7H2BDH5_9MICC|nr:hypothetical protein [Rothia terrae]QNV37721.2 hypothetical protein IDM49_11095 [Rothia terrae]
MPQKPSERMAVTALTLMLFALFATLLIWTWSAIAGRDPLDVFINWIPSIGISLICILVACLKPPRPTGKRQQ